MRGGEFILGYALPFLPLAVLESGGDIPAGRNPGIALGMGILWAILVMLPFPFCSSPWGCSWGAAWATASRSAGSVLILINVAALLSGTWFSLSSSAEPFNPSATCCPLPMLWTQ